MILYHRTTAAKAILCEGFQDREGSYLFEGITLRGVWISDVPLDCNEGTKGEQLIAITLPATIDISDYEIVEDGKPYREWCVPAEILNQAKVRISA